MHFVTTQACLDDSEIFSALAALRSRTHVLLAVSGGPDSMFLMQATAMAKHAGQIGAITVATVDHGLRSESADEAVMVAQVAAQLGLPHETLVWQGLKPVTGIQEAARDSRYRLMAELAARCGANALVTAHTLDDQAETVLMRLIKGSALRGLGGMQSDGETLGVMHCRPLLGLAKARLVATCDARNWRYIHDPSNDNPVYLRTRLRQLLPLLAQEGLTATRFAALAARFGRADAALSEMAVAADHRIGGAAPADQTGLDARLLLSEPDEILIRVLVMRLDSYRQKFGVGSGRPRLEEVESLAFALKSHWLAGETMRRTLGGIAISLKNQRLTFACEGPRRTNLTKATSHSAGLLGNGLPNA